MFDKQILVEQNYDGKNDARWKQLVGQHFDILFFYWKIKKFD